MIPIDLKPFFETETKTKQFVKPIIKPKPNPETVETRSQKPKP